MYSVTDPSRGKLARSGYRIVKETSNYSLLELDLLTGRKNQLRVHLADAGCPIAGDKKYGIKDKTISRLTLHASSIVFVHPFTKERMTVSAPVPSYFDFILKR